MEQFSSDLSFIKLPEGFNISIYADDVKNARGMCLGDEGTIFVGSRHEGKVYALKDNNGDFKVDKKWVLAENINMPVGVAFKNGDLYISAVGEILVLRNIESNLDNPGKPELYSDVFPDNNSHGWRYIAFGPDEKLYVPVGSPCNNCLKEDSIFASITRIENENSEPEIIAHGVRNTVGFDWHPQSGELWFTDNGRDWMGDDLPPCELNRLSEEAAHFGFPFCHGEAISDPENGDQAACENFTAPVQELGPHVAPLGMKFYTGDQFPAEYKNQVFIAEHGSWNRSTKIGYRITLVKLDAAGNSLGYTTFAEGWEQGGEVYGRPVDLLELKDGSLLVSDDYGDKIYRITYGK
ncbi:MAG: PQQ-dependent sugar dehydrogenase [Chitinophagales bacterium]